MLVQTGSSAREQLAACLVKGTAVDNFFSGCRMVAFDSGLVGQIEVEFFHLLC